MTDTPPSPAPLPKVQNDQASVATKIVGALALLGICLIIAGVVAAIYASDMMIAAVAFTGVGTIIGGLCVALNAPSGVAQALKAAKDPGQ